MAEAGPPAGVQVVIEDDRVIDTEAALNACGQEWSFMLELLGYALEEKEDNILKLRQCLQRKWRMTEYRTLSHAMKGAFLNLHLPALRTLTRTMEDYGKVLEALEAEIVVNTVKAFAPRTTMTSESLMETSKDGNKDKQWIKAAVTELSSQGVNVGEPNFERIFLRNMMSFWKHEGRKSLSEAEGLVNALVREYDRLSQQMIELKAQAPAGEND